MVIDKNQDFWVANPGIEASEYFLKIKKLKGSSDLMWALTFCLHPDSPLFNSSNKWEDVKKTILKVDKFNWDSKENISHISEYKELILSVEQKSYLFWCEHMKKRESFCNSVDYSNPAVPVEQVKLVEDMMSKNIKLFEDLKRIKILLENNLDKNKKEKPKSLTDRGLI